MPNHVTNIVTFKGKKEDVENVLIYIQGMGNGDKEIIDFEAISPMPEELKGIRANPKILSEEEYALEMIDFEERQINPTDIDRLVGVSHNLTQKMYNEYMEKFGTVDWYDWHCQNWGTKWNAYDQHSNGITEIDGDNEVIGEIVFDTAWSTPYPVIKKLASMFPEIEIELKWADEDLGSNVGKIKFWGDVTIDEYIPDNCSKEAYELCFEIKEGSSEYFKLVDGNYVYHEEETF